MALKIVLTVLVAVLMVLAGAIVTGQFDIHPAFGLALVLVAVLVAANAFRKTRK